MNSRVILVLLCLAVLGPIADEAIVFAQQDKGVAKLPILQQAGVIPVQWEGNTNSTSKNRISSAFVKAVQSSTRFRLIDSDLVASQWSTPAGREELNKQFELHAYLGLNVATKDDSVQFVFRILGPGLENFLSETETVSRNWLGAASQAELDDRLSNLVYRTLNRLPVDVVITSVQGKFITLSGGKAQRIEVGDDVTLLRAKVTARHPANGSWLEFKTQNLGSATIVEANQNTSVARLTRLIHEGAAEVGDGARIPAIAARNKFKVEPQTPQLVDNGKDDIVIPPQTTDAAENPAQATSPATNSEEAKPTPTLFAAKTDHLIFAIGPRLWDISGNANAAAKFPLWLLNHVSVTTHKTIANHVRSDVGLGLDFGPTTSGSFLGFEVHGRAYYETPLIDSGIKNGHWRAGGLAKLKSIGINNESLGGIDAIMLGGFVGIGGTHAAFEKDLDWYGDFYLTPMTFGQAGVRGTKATIKSSFGWLMVAGTALPFTAYNLDWGMELRYGTQTYSLAGNKELTQKERSILATAKHKF